MYVARGVGSPYPSSGGVPDIVCNNALDGPLCDVCYDNDSDGDPFRDVVDHRVFDEQQEDLYESCCDDVPHIDHNDFDVFDNEGPEADDNANHHANLIRESHNVSTRTQDDSNFCLRSLADN